LVVHASLCASLCTSPCIAAGAPLFAQSARVDTRRLVDELRDDAWMARPDDPAWSLHGASSTDPEHVRDHYANRDAGHVLRILEREGRREGVLVDARGPGALVRLWSANPMGVLRVDVDGERVLELPFERLLSGAGPSPSPLALVAAKGATCLAPVPYARSLLVTVDAWEGLYWQADWRTYAPGSEVTSWRPDDVERWREAAEALRRRDARGEWTHTYSLSNRTERGGDLLALSPAVAQGARAVREIELAVDAEDLERALSGMVLRLSFDGVETVRAPFCEFFGTSARVDPLRTRHLEVAKPARFVARWTMPYRRAFGIAIDSVHDPRVHVSGAVRTEAWDDARPWWRFHAQWRSSGPLATRPRSEVELLHVKGTGRYLGDALHVANPVAAWWGEGDERILVDGRLEWLGTGTEDYYGYAWCSTELYSTPFGAQSRVDGPGNRGRTLVSRQRLLDCIPFGAALQVLQENWHWADTTIERSSTAWYYLAPSSEQATAAGQQGGGAPPTAAELVARLPVVRLWTLPGLLEAEDLPGVRSSEGVELGRQDLAEAEDGRWSGGAHLFARARSAGEWIELDVPVARSGRRHVQVFLTRSHDYGIVAIRVDGREGAVVDTVSGGGIEAPRAVDLGEHELGPRMRLRFEVVGANPASTGARFYFGVDGVLLR
jgi:hypothetical protein